MDKALAMHDYIFRTLILKFNGFEVKTEGDAFMVSFYRILDAVKWCLAVQDALNNHTWPDKLIALKEACIEKHSSGKVMFNGLRVRMGINTGQPFCRVNPVTNRMDYYGPVVNCSARVSDAAHGGQIVCSGSAFPLIQDALSKLGNPIVKDLGFHRMKGLDSDEQIFEITSKKNLVEENLKQ